MLPTTLLPAGVLSDMRSLSNQFMTTPVVIYDETTTYSTYGEKIVTSGVVWSGMAYVGRLSAFDRDLLLQSDFYIRRSDGAELRYLATLLVPFEVEIEDNHSVVMSGGTWHVIWTNEDTSNAVQLYTKALIRKISYESIV